MPPSPESMPPPPLEGAGGGGAAYAQRSCQHDQAKIGTRLGLGKPLRHLSNQPCRQCHAPVRAAGGGGDAWLLAWRRGGGDMGLGAGLEPAQPGTDAGTSLLRPPPTEGLPCILHKRSQG